MVAGKKGCPCEQPFHCQAAVRCRSAQSARRRRDRDVNVTRREPRERLRSSSWMPATAAMDNETLDHLLSVMLQDNINIADEFRFGRVSCKCRARVGWAKSPPRPRDPQRRPEIGPRRAKTDRKSVV